MAALGRTVRLLNCELSCPTDITSDLWDYNLAWLWLCYHSKNGYGIKPEQAMYDFGIDDEVPSNWLVWSEATDKSVSVIHDFQILHSLGVRGSFIINEIGTLTVEKWELTNDSICMFICQCQFREEPDRTIQPFK